MAVAAPPATQSGGSPVDEALLALAPLHLPNRRHARYLGDNICVAIDQLAARDRELLRELYAILSGLLNLLANPETDDAGKWDDLTRWTNRHEVDLIFDHARELGTASKGDGDPDEAIAKAMHDIRGGALGALLGRLQMLELASPRENQLKTLFVLTRDHLKIMRNAVVGLDEPRRQADCTPKSHAMSLMLEKWEKSLVGPHIQKQSLRMHIDCRYAGALTECCLESAAIDRIFYNLANNACRHAAGDRLDMAIFPVPRPPGECLRFVLSNPLNPADAGYLEGLATPGAAKPTPSLLPLFEPRVSTTNSGFGLTVVADFVAGAFGLRDRSEALHKRYVGAVVQDGRFRVWFHWPMANNALAVKTGD